MKAVLDTNVVVAALRSPIGASAEVLRLVRARRLKIAVSTALVLEYEAVTTRTEHLAAAGLTADAVNKVLDVLVDEAEWVRVSLTYRPATHDPADELVLETAINAAADTIVTFNKRDFGDTTARFGIKCRLPMEVLEKLR